MLGHGWKRMGGAYFWVRGYPGRGLCGGGFVPPTGGADDGAILAVRRMHECRDGAVVALACSKMEQRVARGALAATQEQGAQGGTVGIFDKLFQWLDEAFLRAEPVERIVGGTHHGDGAVAVGFHRDARIALQHDSVAMLRLGELLLPLRRLFSACLSSVISVENPMRQSDCSGWCMSIFVERKIRGRPRLSGIVSSRQIEAPVRKTSSSKAVTAAGDEFIYILKAENPTDVGGGVVRQGAGETFHPMVGAVFAQDAQKQALLGQFGGERFPVVRVE